MLKESITGLWYLIFALLLGYVAYGLSILFYIKAQSGLGASKTSAFYAINPFIATALSLIILKESFKWNYLVALIIMMLGTTMIIYDIVTTKSNTKTIPN